MPDDRKERIRRALRRILPMATKARRKEGTRLSQRDRELLEAWGVVSANVTVIRGRPTDRFIANFTVIDTRSARCPTNVTIITDD